MFNWNNLRFFLAIAKEGGTLAAARALCVNSQRCSAGLPIWKPNWARGWWSGCRPAIG